MLLHPGFHKTGTSTAQAFLKVNRKQIFPGYALMLPARTRGNGLVNRAFNTPERDIRSFWTALDSSGQRRWNIRISGSGAG